MLAARPILSPPKTETMIEKPNIRDYQTQLEAERD